MLSIRHSPKNCEDGPASHTPTTTRKVCTIEWAIYFAFCSLALINSGCFSVPEINLTINPSSPQLEAEEKKLDQVEVEPPVKDPVWEVKWKISSVWPTPLDGPEALLGMKDHELEQFDFIVTYELKERKQTLQWSCEQLVKDYREEDEDARELLSICWEESQLSNLRGLNATILLARVTPENISEKHIEILQDGVRDQLGPKQDQPDIVKSFTSTPLITRRVAIETLGNLWEHSSDDPESKYAWFGNLLLEKNIPRKIRAVCYRFVAKEIAPNRIPGLSDDLTSKDKLTQQQAVEACLLYAIHHHESFEEPSDELDLVSLLTKSNEEDWPEGLLELMESNSTQIAIAMGKWLAVTKHPQAETYLTKQLQHINSVVQHNAVCSLGLLNSKTKEAVLQDRLESSNGNNKAVVIRALGYHHPEEMFQYAHDEDMLIRKAVAHMAGYHPSRKSHAILSKLIIDREPSVQLAAVNAVSHWEMEMAYPILAIAFEDGMFKTRQQVREILEKNIEVKLGDYDDTREARSGLMKQIRNEYLAGLSSSPLQEEKPLAEPLEDSTVIRGQVRAWVEKILRADISVVSDEELLQEYLQLKDLSGTLVDQAIGQLTAEDLNRLIAHEAIAEVEPFKSLNEFNSTNYDSRRAAAEKIAASAQEKTPPEWLFRVLERRLGEDQDPQICRAIMRTIDNETTPGARAVGAAALRHPWSDVRLLGCRYVENHRVIQLAPLLIPLFTERNTSIQHAAIRAAGLSRNPIVLDGIDTANQSSTHGGGLRSLLGTVSRSVEREVLVAMARLQDEQGRAELLKMTYATDVPTRRDTLLAIQSINDPYFAPALVRRLWLESDLTLKRLILKTLEDSVPEEQSPKWQVSDDLDARTQLWSEWLEKSSPVTSIP